MARHWLGGFLLRPFRDTLRGLDNCLEAGWRGLAAAGLGLLAGWWLYVPAHELLHAAACRAAGGEVRRLEIDTVYGGAAFARVFPFVTAGSAYAGRLSGFDDHGSDLIYLATDLGPFVLTLFPGVWALRRASALRHPLLFGAALPVALAPFLSLGGDAYEMGAILTTRLPPWSAPAVRDLLRGDDLPARIAALLRLGMARPLLWSGLGLALLAGMALAWLIYGAGSVLARWAGEAEVGGA